jgi:hypothetical protein
MAIWVSQAHSAPICPAQVRPFSALTQETRAGNAPGSRGFASSPQQSQPPTPRPRRLVYWPAVGIVALVVWLLVGGLLWLLYQDGQAATAAMAGEPVQLAQATPPGITDASVLMESSTQPGADGTAPFVSVPLSARFPQDGLNPAEKITPARQLPASELSSGRENVACETYGTQVSFLSNPADAARRAAKEHKLLFVLHLSGNFEEARFT